MRIVIENGGTKLDWTIVEEKKIYSAESINVFNSEKKILTQLCDIFPKRLLRKKNLLIDFYTAGLTGFTEKKMKKILTSFFYNPTVVIFSDLLAASRALFKDKDGIVCILGTGSNCAYFDGVKNHSITHALGHLLGDEGSGYDLGKIFLINYFQDNISLELQTKFEDQVDMKKDELLSAIYKSENQKFYIASFAKFLKENESDSFVQKIITDSFLSFFNKHPFQFKSFSDYQFGFVGSVAFNFSLYIEDILNTKCVSSKILKNPIEHLIDYY